MPTSAPSLKASKLRVGIAGFGVVGKKRRHYIDLNPHLKTVAICDRTLKPNDQTEADKNNHVHYYSHYKDLLQHEELDVLFVCLTNDIAAEVTMAGIAHNLHVFCEKPPGRNLHEIAQVRAAIATQPHLKLKYGFNHRYHDSVIDALRIIQNKTLGEIINLRGVYGKSKFITFGQNPDWRTQREIAGGGILLDQGIHMVDLLRTFAGEFIDVYSFISNNFWQYDVEDNAYAILRTADGKVAMLHSSATQWRHHFQLDISLQKGSIILSGILSGSKSYGSETITIAFASSDERGDPKEQTTRYNEDHSWQNEITEFAQAIVADGNIVHGTVDDAYKTMELVHKIYIADEKWKTRWGLA